jgi:hypothetical protein
MSDASPAKPLSAISTNAAWLAMIAIVTFQLLLVALIFLRPDLDPAWHSISEWAIGPHGWIMSCAFLISSLSYLALFVMLKSQLRTPIGRVGLAILLLCAIGAAGAGICTTDPMPFRPPLSIRGTLHIICGTAQLVLFPWAALLVSLSLARTNPLWLPLLCRLHSAVCRPQGARGVRPRGQYWLASAGRVLCLHALDRNPRIPGNPVQPPGVYER